MCWVVHELWMWVLVEPGKGLEQDSCYWVLAGPQEAGDVFRAAGVLRALQEEFLQSKGDQRPKEEV